MSVRELNEEELASQLKTVKERVEFLLRNYPNARNSDLYLTILYLRRFTELGKYLNYVPYEVIKKYEGVFESVRRVRQYIQNTLGKYPPTDPEVIKRRRRKERAMRRVMGGDEI